MRRATYPSFSFLATPFACREAGTLYDHVFRVFYLGYPVFFSAYGRVVLRTQVLLMVDVVSSGFRRVSRLVCGGCVFLIYQVFRGGGNVFL